MAFFRFPGERFKLHNLYHPAINRIVGNLGNFDGFGQVIASKQLP
jgi:hypothetical protein